MKQLTIIFSFLLVSFCFATDSGREGTHNKVKESDNIEMNLSVLQNLSGVETAVIYFGRETEGADTDGIEHAVKGGEV